MNGAIIDAAAAFNQSDDMLVVDPFTGGGVIPMSALKRRHRVYAQDLSPWVTLGLTTALGLPSSKRISEAADVLLESLSEINSKAYGTRLKNGAAATLSHTFRVAMGNCPNCSLPIKLYPHALVTRTIRKDRRHRNEKTEKGFIACRNGHLYQAHANSNSRCPTCHVYTDPAESYLAKRLCTCPHCGTTSSLSDIANSAALRWEIVLVERAAGALREIGIPTRQEIQAANSDLWNMEHALGPIPSSQETRVLIRHGFQTWDDLYPVRQKFVIRHLLDKIDDLPADKNVRQALTMAILGTTEMAGYLSRWDRHYLKSYESMASHRFNFTTFSAEPNVIGLNAFGRGSFYNRIQSLKKAADWLNQEGIDLPMRKAVKSTNRNNRNLDNRLSVVCGSSERILLEAKSADLILTDPPYHDDVQYHELSLPFRAWAGLETARGAGEAVAIPHSQELKGHASYREQLIPIFSECRRIMKPTGRLIFSYANREPAAWVNLFAALKSARLQPVAFTIVRSENETETGKRSRRSFSLDLIMELARSDLYLAEQWAPNITLETDEESFLLCVGHAFLKSKRMVNGWEQHLLDELNAHAFVKPTQEDALADTSLAIETPILTKSDKKRLRSSAAPF